MNPRHNALLEHLPATEYEQFLPHLELKSLVKGDVLFKTGELPRHVYFPVGAVISIMCEFEDGYSVEFNMVGTTSMVGLTNVGGPSFYRAEVRGSGFAYCVAFDKFQHIRKSCPIFVGHQSQAQLNSLRYISLTGACGKHHSVDQQLIRWILINLDRSVTPQIFVTHSELSRLLGFRREAITLALGKLAEIHAITLARGELVVLDRLKLEERSCECYWRITEKSRPQFTSLRALSSQP